ncbi:MAG: sigma-54-dependent Fis family transcriptional regulator [Planctomycetota bacterium]|nr:MAG: sigma-54-dependent Fis family transcriptional regulator [Planctomycetota bacterium]
MAAQESKLPRVLVVDDEPDQLEVFRLNFRKDFSLQLAGSGAEALDLLGTGPEPAVLLTDQRMPGMSGVELLERAKEIRPDTVRMVVTAYKDAESILEAVNRGDVYRYVVKPWDTNELRMTIGNAVERYRLVKENQRLLRQLQAVNQYLQTEIQQEYDYEDIVGRDGGLRETFASVEKVAPTRSTVLIRGETGTGKELVARAIHYTSPRAGKPLVKVNCAALPETLLESELFGHERGAFTGAERRKPGRFELADGGTLFLDEIGDISPAMQVRLLRVLQEREFERVGGTETVKVDVRLIAATHRDLEAMVKRGDFREDLYFRLTVIPIEIPPLRKRKADIPELARFFLRRHAKEAGRLHLEDFSADAISRLVSYPWPGNVRELENVVERAVILAGDGSRVEASDLRFLDLGARRGPELEEAPSASAPLPRALEKIERDELVRAMEEAGGSKAAAARALGINRSTLYYRLRKHGLAERYGLPPESG